MVTKRNFNASTKRQNRAVDAILALGFFPSEIEIKSYDIWMWYSYKDLSNKDSLLVIIVSPSGEYELYSNTGLDIGITGKPTTEGIVTYFQTQIACGYKFDFQNNYRDNHKEDNKVKTHTMNDAVEMVLSDGYKERFIAEYVETKIRYERLHSIIIKWCAGKADFVTDIELLEEQAKHMGNYLKTLEIRAVKEDIELPNVDWRK